MPLPKADHELLLSVARTSLASKFIGAEEDFFAQMIVNAIQSVKVVSLHMPLTLLCKKCLCLAVTLNSAVCEKEALRIPCR